MKLKITTLVITIVTLAAGVFGRLAYSGIGDLLTDSSGLGAVTAAESLAGTIKGSWLRSVDLGDAIRNEEYQRLKERLNAPVGKGTISVISVLRFESEAREVTYIASFPEDESADYFPPGSRRPESAFFIYRERHPGYELIGLDRPGFYMAGWAPIFEGENPVGLVVLAIDVSRIKSALNTVSLLIAGTLLVLIFLSGLVAYKFASSFEKTAVTDGLMGIYNHKYFKQRLEEEVAKAKRYGQQTSVVLFDIDFFKRVNDTYGHATGDLVLKLMAKWVTDLCRNTDVICRYGGEEIVCILPHTGIAGAQEFAERLRLKVSEQVVRDPEEDAEFRVTVSVGVAQWQRGMAMMDMVKHADAALYHSKRTGRNRVTLYQEELLPAPQEMASKPERTKDRH